MQALDLILQMDALLVEERVAIARLDGARVEALAIEKKRLADALERVPKDERQELAPRLKLLVIALKRNGVLLAHARSILSELLTGTGAVISSTRNSTIRPLGRTSAYRLSVRG